MKVISWDNEPEAENAPKWGMAPGRPPAHLLEASILAHQARVDAVRNAGGMLDEDVRYRDRSLSNQPGYENSPQGIRYGKNSRGDSEIKKK